ncbi:uracil-DNA glycosylase [Aurantimonas sp. 22II-16-19i]|uniref:uracil-DNA glycosylase n=1 Tax=Aurantimonas sp. 22II-16-19i TaxID=1317114 RepID=UPI0009F7AB76|nr:uracil-DNA glycosylase [Aurantimonas sp. 22II-16-19i]ORE89878.1 uracil-DNA glycosylase, family 4 [Aurantimonas sp. 22II-16-19i]
MLEETPRLTRDAAVALLAWYREAGIESLLLDQPRDRFAETAAETERRKAKARPAGTAATQAQGRPDGRPDGRAESVQRERGAPSAPPSPPSRQAFGEPSPTTMGDSAFPSTRIAIPDDAALADARERAVSAASLAELRELLHGFGGCNLKITAKHTVFGDGPDKAELMLIGEAPGRDEDMAGVPFVGRSGQLLNRMLAAIGIERESVRVTNTVPWRPPGNRAPTPAETRICLPFVQRQIELVAPKVIVCLGSPSAKAILGSAEGILRIRGKWQSYSFDIDPGATIPAIAMLHPAYLLRQPAQKKLAWQDLLALKAKLDEL